jgi:DNA invertase Pin-like site-specific DNA recombinase
VLIGYMRVSKADGSQVLDLQRDALIAAGVKRSHLYEDQASGKKDDRPGLEACLKALREGDTLIVWKLDRLGRNLRHLVNTIHDLMERGICFRVLTGQGANIDTTTASGRLVFGIFAALAEFERELIRERTIAGLASARARGRNGGRPYTMTPAKLRLAQAAMAKRDTKVSDLCTELGVTRQTLYRFVGPKEGGGVTRKRRNNPMQRQNWLTKIPTGARDLRLLNCYPCLSSSAKAARDCLISSDE